MTTKRKKKAPTAPPPPAFPRVYEGLGEPCLWGLNHWAGNNPSAFNGIVQVEKFRVTVDRVEEPVEVIRERIAKLWAECENHHHWAPLHAKAAKYGMELHHQGRTWTLKDGAQ
jgi:hypothetical protein